MRKRMPLIIIILLIILLALGYTYHRFKTNSLRAALRPLAQKDVALAKDLIKTATSLDTLPLTQVSKRADSNVSFRQQLMAGIKSLNPYLYKKQINLLLELMDLENEYARSLVALKQARLEAGQQPETEEVTEVEEVVSKTGIVYKQRKFKRTLMKFQESTAKAQAAFDRHYIAGRKLLAFEIEKEKELTKIIPPRNVAPLLEKALKGTGAGK